MRRTSLRAAGDDPVEERLARRQRVRLARRSGRIVAAQPGRARVGVRLPARRIAALIDHGERLMAHLSMVRLTLARLADDAQAPWSQIDAELAGAASALAAQLDSAAESAPLVAESDSSNLALLPERPAARMTSCPGCRAASA